MRSEKDQTKLSRKERVWFPCEGREKKEGKLWAHQRHVTFVTGKIIERMTASISKSD